MVWQTLFAERGCQFRQRTRGQQTYQSLIRLTRVLVFHLKDSKTELGSHVDRHAGIGRGKIGRESFRCIINDDRFRDSPGCLETPKSADLHEDVENLAILRSRVE